MSSLSRSIRNVFRNPTRTIVVIIIIGLSMGVFLTMNIVSENIADNASSISEGLETTITVRPAGDFGFTGSGETIPDDVVQVVNDTANVESLQEMVIQMDMTITMTRPSGKVRGTPVQGVEPSYEIILISGGTIALESGRLLAAGDENSAVAIVGTIFASNNGLGVGSSTYLNGTTSVEVVGTFSSGNKFADRAVIVPVEIAKIAYNMDGVSTIYAMVDSIGNMNAVEAELKDQLGEDYDVVPLSTLMADRSEALQDSIDSIEANSQMGSYIALITAVVVMIFIMILITRERTKEIGVLKAIGFKNSNIMAQFFTESMTLAALGFVVGVVIVMVAGPAIAGVMLGTGTGGSSEPTPTAPDGTHVPSGGGGGMGSGSITSGFNALSNVDFTLQFDLLLFAFIMALALGIIGSMYPILKALKLKPAEALRYE